MIRYLWEGLDLISSVLDVYEDEIESVFFQKVASYTTSVAVVAGSVFEFLNYSWSLFLT